MQDSNGNFIALTYQTGTYAVEAQSSSRILPIEDARASNNITYQLTYTTVGTPHLASISGPDANYTFLMTDNVALNSPFTGDSTTFPSAWRLERITGSFGLQHNFTYNANNCGELTKVTFPYGGSLGWQFRDFTFSDQRVIRDMWYRTLNDGINGDQSHSFWHDDQRDLNTSNHYQTDIFDASNTSLKRWNFDNATGLQTHLYELALTSPNWTLMRYSDLYWIADTDGNPYISNSYSTIDPISGNHTTNDQQIARTDQTRDNFGNVLQMKVYDYNNQITPNRTYDNTLRTDMAYANHYIRNLLATSKVTIPTVTGPTTIDLMTNAYDTDPGCYGDNTATPPDGTHEFDSTYNGNGPTNRGNLCQTITPGSARHIYYNRAGTVTSTQDAVGHTVTSTPDASRNYAVPSAISTGNLTSSMTWNGAFQLTGSTNPNGAATSLAYDAYARPAGGQSPYGATTSIAYTNSGTKTVTTNSRWTKTTTDGFGRAVKVESGNGTTTLSSSETEYAPCACTPMGKVKRVSQPHA